jgi:hypothetical protein
MEELLAKCCAHMQIHQKEELRAWLVVVKHVSTLMRAEQKEFEVIAKVSRMASHRNNMLLELSQNYNNGHPHNLPCGRGSIPIENYLPKLTKNECTLLLTNDGCLKCHHFQVNHHATNCLNPFPSLNNYQTLMQADTD